MADDQEPAKKTAKRIVKKTVVRRPASQRPEPALRYGRPAPKPAAKAPAAKAKAKAKPTAPKKTVVLGKRATGVGKAVSGSTGKAASAVGGGIKGAAGMVGSTGSSAFQSARAWRIPRFEQTVASAIVGVLVGLIAVLITVLFTMLFSELRGTSTGGGRWGSLTFVVVTFIAFALGELFLARMHVRQPRVTSFLAICLTLFVILAVFLKVIGGMWAWLIVPTLAAAAYAISHRVIRWADTSGSKSA